MRHGRGLPTIRITPNRRGFSHYRSGAKSYDMLKTSAIARVFALRKLKYLNTASTPALAAKLTTSSDFLRVPVAFSMRIPAT